MMASYHHKSFTIMQTIMKQFFAVFALFALVAADLPINQDGSSNAQGYNNNNNGIKNNLYNSNNNVPIVRFDNDINEDSSYNYAYETGDGTQAQQSGYIKDVDSLTAQGAFAFTAPDGQQFSISYTADENGYLPQGAHIPTPPPIPVEILKALEQNKADEERGIVDDGQYRAEAAPHQQYNNPQQNFNNNNKAQQDYNLNIQQNYNQNAQQNYNNNNKAQQNYNQNAQQNYNQNAQQNNNTPNEYNGNY